MIIDSHAHLDYPQLSGDLPAVLARAAEAGVDRVITIGVKLSIPNIATNMYPIVRFRFLSRLKSRNGRSAVKL